MALFRRATSQIYDLLRTKVCGAVLNHQPERATCVFRRMYPPRLYKKDGRRPDLKAREKVYILEENTLSKPAGDIKVILISDVEGLGFAGDEVTVSKPIARSTLFPADLAVYSNAYNMEKTEHLRQRQAGKPRQSMWAQKTMRALKNMNLPVPMNPKVNWILNETHVRVAFRNAGVIMDDDCIVLPEEPISEPQNLQIKIIVNKVDSVMVNAIVYHYYSDLREAPGGVLPDLPPVWEESAQVSLAEIALEHARKIGPAPPPIL